VAAHVPLGAAAVGTLDRVDAEGQVVATVEDLRCDDPLSERVVQIVVEAASAARLGQPALAGRAAQADTG
jgi:hypothetical protein